MLSIAIDKCVTHDFKKKIKKKIKKKKEKKQKPTSWYNNYVSTFNHKLSRFSFIVQFLNLTMTKIGKHGIVSWHLSQTNLSTLYS